MSERARVQRWRQRQRAAGKEPLTIWLTTAEKLRLEDMALTQRCSPSELVSRMLVQWHDASSPVTDAVTDAEQLRSVTDTVTDTIRQELPLLVRLVVEELQLQSPLSVTDTVTDTILQGVTDTVTARRTSPWSHAGNIDVTAAVTNTQSAATLTVTDTEEAIETAYVTATGTDTSTSPPAKRKAPSRQRPVTDPVTVTEVKHRGRKPVLREPILALLREHQAGLTAAELKVYLKTDTHIGDTLSGMVKAALLVKAGSAKAVRDQLATPEAD